MTDIWFFIKSSNSFFQGHQFSVHYNKARKTLVCTMENKLSKKITVSVDLIFSKKCYSLSLLAKHLK